MRASGTKAALLTVVSTVVAALGVVVIPTPAQAAPPSNDDFANAQVLTGMGVVTGTNVDATTETGEPVRHITDDNVDYAATASVWYQWTSPDGASQPTVQVSTRGSDFDTVLAVYSGGPALNGLTEVVADDDYDVASGPSRAQFVPTPDTTYWIAVDSCCDGSASGTGSIRLRLSTTTGEGTIEGYVTSDGTHGIDGICVVALDDTGERVSVQGSTDAAGNYLLPGVEAGPDRHIKYWSCGSSTYAGQFNGGAQTLATAPDIAIANGQNLTGVDEVLVLGGSISGTVSADDAGYAGSLADVCVRATMVGEPDDGFSRQVTTDGTGAYTIDGLDGGQYLVRFGGDCGPNAGFTSEYYDDAQDIADADLVTVDEGTPYVAVNAGLSASPGAISGTVQSWETGPGIPNICVRASNSSFVSPSVNTDASGGYTITNVPAAADYVVRFSDCHASSNPLTTQWYNRALKQSSATTVAVTAGNTTSGIGASMFRAATLGGQITDPNGNPRDPACVNVYKSDDVGTPIDSATTDTDGRWSVQVPPGNYKIEMLDCGGGGLSFETRWYHDATSAGAATILFVDQGDVEDALDQVTPGTAGSDGRIVGRVTDDSAGLNPLEGICVTATRSGIDTNTTTDAQGRYEFGNLLPDDYIVRFSQCDLDQPYNVLPQYWEDVTSPGAATPVVVSPGTTTSGIVARMHPAGSIAGTVTDGSGDPIDNICVTAFTLDDSVVGQIFTDPLGQYEIKGLESGSYKVSFEDCNYIYVSQWWDGQPYDGDPTPVVIVAGPPTTGIDAEMARYGTISGTVTDEAGAPLEDMCVIAYDENGAFAFSAATDANGDYLIGALGDPDSVTPVPYAVEFFDCSGTYGDEFYDNKLDFGSADLVDVTFGLDTPGIDAVLQDTAPVNTAAPEARGRSVVGVSLRATNGTWSHEPSAFTFQWYRCQADGSDCLAVDAANQREYKITALDEGFRFRVDVTARNSKGTTTAESALTDVVVTASPPPNDDIDDREELIGALPIVVAGDNVDATRQPGEPDHLGLTVGASVWYEWTAPSGGGALDMVTIDLDGSTFDTTLSVYDGTPTPFSGLHLVAENDDYDSATSAVTFEPVAGTTYYVAVDGYYDSTTHTVDTGSIDLRLTTATGVTGTVTDENGDPIRDICVTATDTPDPSPVGPSVNSSADGTYFLELAPGTWYVDFYDCTGQYEEQWYDDVTDPEDATAITVVDGVVSTGIDAEMVELVPFGSISGTVENEAGEPIPDICVVAVSDWYASGGYAYTDANGTFTVRGLGDPDHPANVIDYIVGFSDCSGFYGDEFYDNKLDPDDADLVPLTLDQDVTDIDAVLQHEAPVNTTLPAISGNTGDIGSTLTATNGQWDHEPSVFAYQWLQCDAAGVNCLPINDADGPTYVTVAGDAGHRVRVEVTASNSIGDTSARSAATAAIGAPVLVTAPVITGTAGVGNTLSVGTGTWTGSPTSYEYQWQRCNDAITICTGISGEENTTHQVTAADNGYRLRARVTAVNATGSTPTWSATTIVVGAPTMVTAPVVSGTSSVGGTLTVSNGTWTGSPTSFEYQWQRCNAATTICTPISGEENTTHQVTAGDNGYRLRARVTAVNATGSTPTWSGATTVIGAPTVVTAPTVSGPATVGGTLSVTSGTWNGSPTSYAYQWQRCNTAITTCTAISGEQATTYVITSADNGYRLRAQVTAVNAAGSTPTWSGATTVIGAPTVVTAPTVSGPATVGGTLSVTSGTWTGSPTSYAYQWQRCNTAITICTVISGEQATTYVITSADIGYRLRAQVTAVNAAGSTPTWTAATTSVGAPVLLIAPTTAVPVITGTPSVGNTLSVSTGTWTGSPSSFEYQWQRCNIALTICTAIDGEQATSYVITSDDIGYRLRARVTAVNATGSTPTWTASTTAVSAPVLLIAPTVSGPATVGSTLTATHGTWTGSPTSYEYQWQRCSTAITICTAIDGEQATTHVITAADIGYRLRAQVTAVNATGSTPTWTAAAPAVS